jgi:hypothetical protein
MAGAIPFFTSRRPKYKVVKATPRRFPPPWTVEDNGACFIAKDRNGHALAYVYYEEEPADDPQP